MILYKRVKAYNKGMLNTNYRNFEDLKISSFTRDFRNENKMTRKSTAYWMNFNPTDTEYFGYLGRVPTITTNSSTRVSDGRKHEVIVTQLIGPKLENGKFSNKFSEENGSADKSTSNFKKAMKTGELAYKEALIQG